MTLSHELVNMLRERDLNMIERRLIRPFARPIKGNDLIARVTARDQAEADWMVTALSGKGQLPRSLRLRVAERAERDDRCIADRHRHRVDRVSGSGRRTEHRTGHHHLAVISWRSWMYYEHNFEISTIRDAARTMRTPAVESRTSPRATSRSGPSGVRVPAIRRDRNCSPRQVLSHEYTAVL